MTIKVRFGRKVRLNPVEFVNIYAIEVKPTQTLTNLHLTTKPKPTNRYLTLSSKERNGDIFEINDWN
jgi:hypothetical protein